jgi:DNA-binding NarL/FixJ family response regulator
MAASGYSGSKRVTELAEAIERVAPENLSIPASLTRCWARCGNLRPVRLMSCKPLTTRATNLGLIVEGKTNKDRRRGVPER